MDPNRIGSLTQREIEVLWLLDTRLSKQEIAAVLHIPSETVERHAASIFRKLGLRTRAQSGGSRNAVNS